ncbi:MAG: futalosine hydrolase [Chitinophagaceae bacterium]|nr:futalosine hydrolase [Chitinophagaceae bacterium]
MNILIVAATPQEVVTTRQYLAEKKYQRKDCSVHILITGVGLTNTTYSLTKYLSKTKPDLVIQAGIGGSFHPFYPPGSVYIINEEIFGDLGVEEGSEFKDVFDLGLAENSFPYADKWLVNPNATILNKIKLKQVRGVSINEITTNAGRIHQLMEKYNVIVESMEGAAFHYVCLQEHIPFVQLRAVSNFVGERDKSRWLIKEAIENLNQELILAIRPLLCY